MARQATLRAQGAVPNGSAGWRSECASRVCNSAVRQQASCDSARLPMRAAPPAAVSGAVALSAPQSFAYRCVSMLGNLIAAKVATECILEAEGVASGSMLRAGERGEQPQHQVQHGINRSAWYIDANAARSRLRSQMQSKAATRSAAH